MDNSITIEAREVAIEHSGMTVVDIDGQECDRPSMLYRSIQRRGRVVLLIHESHGSFATYLSPRAEVTLTRND